MKRKHTRRYLIAALIAVVAHASLFLIAYLNEMSIMNLLYFKKHPTEFLVETVDDEGATGTKPIEQKPLVEEEKHNENTGTSIRDTEVVKGITDTLPENDTNLYADTVSGSSSISDTGEILSSNGFGGYGEYGNFGIQGIRPKFQNRECEYFTIWFREKFNYPQDIADGYNERVKLTFVIDKRGRIKNTTILGCTNTAVKNEILKVLVASPIWTPAEVKGITREYTIEMYINFKKY
jgi:hypothetical protein